MAEHLPLIAAQIVTLTISQHPIYHFKLLFVDLNFDQSAFFL
ncbi:MAG: hypothetical protein JWO58_3311 [Chitinophagaceae bacterium]|nr:hypothetical protein [Chitinophagaceae bacterium]